MAETVTYGDHLAIVGIGVRFPGNITTPHEFWRALTEGRDLIGTYPRERWERIAPLLDPTQRPAEPPAAGIIDHDFDGAFFGIGPRERAQMDPQHGILLEVVHEALADTAIPPSSLAGSATGVFVGAASFDQATLTLGGTGRVDMQTAAGSGMALLSGRVSHFLDARGISATTDTACSSSLVATHEACRALQAGDVSTAIVAGTNILSNPRITASLDAPGVMSQLGRCRPFDTRGDGYVRGEGVGAVVIMRHADAAALGLRPYALIEASLVNSDGFSNGLGLHAPNVDAQRDLLTDVYYRAGIDRREVDYIEAHGTATAAGDRVEATAICDALGPGRPAAEPVLVGSVKSNLGHLEGAAGIAGLIKTALALHHGEIPPTINHDEKRPSLRALPFEVPTRAVAWPERGRPRRAGVSGFGFSGTNAHVVLRGVSAGTRAPAQDRAERRPELLALSAPSAAALRETAARLAAPVGGQPDLAASARTLLRGRDHHASRAAIRASDPGEAADALRALAEGRTHPALAGPRRLKLRPRRRAGRAPASPVVFVFPGHGAHWEGMGMRLAERLPAFAAELERVRAALGEFTDDPWSPEDSLDPFVAKQHGVFAMQVALTAVWRSWGVEPGALIGHSLGEAAAAHIAGALSLRDAARLVVARSRQIDRTSGTGHMLVTELTPAQAAEAIAGHGDDLAVAVHNGPRTTVVSGRAPALDAVEKRLTGRGVWVRRITDVPPGHCALLDPYLPELRAALVPLAPQAVRIPMISTSTGRAVDGGELDADYWTAQARGRVRMVDALLLAADHAKNLHRTEPVFLEIGPRGVVGPNIEAVLTDGGWPGTVVSARRPSESRRPAHTAVEPVEDEYEALVAQAADLYTCGPVPMGVAPADAPVAALPPMVWDRSSADEGAEGVDASELMRRDPAAAVALVLADTLGLASDVRLDPSEELLTLGMHSMKSLELARSLRALDPRLVDLPLAEVAQSATVRELADSVSGWL
ncbi:beta-ketoacyl synthase N-terminal-like domain-containing protein [Nocardiopsis mangrovi]|uniref:Beta-ketoacyl synthase N-terminal-like domain-containing protein n=1 Tax=Nocardiopsis mangrovi TaxID=1179818 RepID=A0ABV9DS52_9ACTN